MEVIVVVFLFLSVASLFFLKDVKPSFRYSLKVWLSAALISPAIYGITNIFTDFDSALAIMILAILFGVPFSATAMGLFFLLVNSINKVEDSIFHKKIIVAFVSALFTAFFCYYFAFTWVVDVDGKLGINKIILTLCYVITVIVSIFFYRLEADVDVEETGKEMETHKGKV